MIQQTKQELRIPAARHIGTLLYVVALMLAWMIYREREWPIAVLALWLGVSFCSIPGAPSSSSSFLSMPPLPLCILTDWIIRSLLSLRADLQITAGQLALWHASGDLTIRVRI